MTTASGLADALVTMLTATSVFGASMVAKSNYLVLEQSSGSCAVVSFTAVDTRVDAHAHGLQRIWENNVEIFIRDTGDADTVLNRIYSAVDATLLCLESDDTIQGQVSEVVSTNIRRDRNRFVEAGGATWLPIEVSLETRELL